MLVTIITLISTVGFEFLSVDPVAERAGMGYALHGDGYDVHYNPGGLAFSDNIYYSVSYLNYFGGTHFGYLGYERRQVGLGLRYFYSGSMKKVDEYQQEYGTFGVYHIDINIGKGFFYKDVGVGISLKAAYATIDSLNALGIGLDIGAMYILKDPGVQLGFAVKNIGYGVKSFVESQEMFPYEITLSAAKVYDVGWFGLDLVKPAVLGFGARFGGVYQINPFLNVKASYSTLLSGIRTEGIGFLAGLTIGLGITKDKLTVNYSYSPYFDLGGGHRVSIGFGG